MLTFLGLLLVWEAIENAVWASDGGHYKVGLACAVDAVVWAFFASYLLWYALN